MPSAQVSRVTRLSGSGRSSVMSHQGTAWCFHGFEDETGGEGWGVALHHLVVEAADGLD